MELITNKFGNSEYDEIFRLINWNDPLIEDLDNPKLDKDLIDYLRQMSSNSGSSEDTQNSVQGAFVGDLLASMTSLSTSSSPFVNQKIESITQMKINRSKTDIQHYSDDKQFICPHLSCNWRFKRSDTLLRHIRTHTNDKPYMCQICYKRFTRSDSLREHLKLHKDNLPEGMKLETILPGKLHSSCRAH
jgi:uncharacterized Zn-finger protein